MRILIVLPGAIGDVVRGLPLLGRIRRAWPAAEIGWSVEPLSAPVLDGHPWLDRVHVFRRRQGWRGLLEHVRELRAQAYEVSIDLGRGLKSGGIAFASGARRRLGFGRRDGREGNWMFATEHLPAQGVQRPKLEQCWRFGDLLGLPDAPIGFGLRPTAAESRRARVLLGETPGPVVVASLGSSCPSRRWFPERTAATLRALYDGRGLQPVLLGTEADRAFADAVLAATPGPAVDLVGQTTLRDALAVLDHAAVVLGPDSGALHLAAALGRPVVSLWGATSHARSAPHGSGHLVVEGESACAPCFLRVCPIGRVCMEAISVDAVLRGVSEALDA